MTDSELRNIGINGTLDSDICLENGILNKKNWIFDNSSEIVTNTQFIKKYVKIDSDDEVYLVSNITDSDMIDGTRYNKYQFYKSEKGISEMPMTFSDFNFG